MKVCQICKLELALNQYGNNKTKLDGKQSYCKLCSKAKDRKHYDASSSRKSKIRKRDSEIRKQNRRWVIDYLSKTPCVDCGEADIACLDFDHIGHKRNQVSKMKGLSLKTIQEEISKCKVRCSNCHRKRHARESNWYESLK